MAADSVIKNSLRDLSQYELPSPGRMFYIPEFITVAQEQQILNNIYAQPKVKWTQLQKRRLQMWGMVFKVYVCNFMKLTFHDRRKT